ncbi:MAG: fatty acid desaturase [Bacteroidota bacterium]|nr:fatty acid desaturase [Bacteroidota bacterium]
MHYPLLSHETWQGYNQIKIPYVRAMLRYRADIRTLLNVALYFTVAIVPWFLWPTMTRPQIVMWVLVNCLMSFICAVIVHNTIHTPIFKSRWMNKVFQMLLSFTYGHSTSAYVPGHNFSHHKYTQGNKDAIRTSKARFKLNILNQLFFFFIMSGDILKGEIRFANKMRTQHPAWFRQYLLEMILVMGTNVVLLVINWKCALLFVLLPHQYAAWGIVGTNYFQHDGCDEDDEFNHSRNFSGRFLNWVIFNNGFHGAHHMKPNLHWSLLRAYHNEKLKPFIDPSLDRNSLLSYLFTTHIYPAKRVDFKGQPLVLAPLQADEDWVAGINVARHQTDMSGA